MYYYVSLLQIDLVFEVTCMLDIDVDIHIYTYYVDIDIILECRNKYECIPICTIYM